jgi:hypothetical protein
MEAFGGIDGRIGHQKNQHDQRQADGNQAQPDEELFHPSAIASVVMG